VSVHNRTDWNIWKHVRNETVGGVTQFVGLFCLSMELLPVLSTLQHTIHHVVDYGARSTCAKHSDARLNGALMLKFLLHPSNLHQPSITYPTHFCYSGVGYRLLDSNEYVFGFKAITRIGGLALDASQKIIM
jgi:hypothetical protein